MLDSARAVAVVAMIFGHTMSALLSPEARSNPWVISYWHVRAYTAPLFMFISGFVLLFVVERRSLRGVAVIRGFAARVGLLFGIGFFLRLPLWNLGGLFRLEPEVLRHFFSFDALHCVASAMVVLLLVCASVASRWGRIAVLAALAVAVTLGAPDVWAFFDGDGRDNLFAWSLGGSVATFPLFPSVAYFFFGACLGALPSHGTVGRLIFISALAGLFAAPYFPWGQLPQQAPIRIVGSLAVLAGVIVFASVLPKRWARFIAPVGRASLWAYVVHLVLVHGWGYWGGLSQTIGQTLLARSAALTSLGMIAFSVTAAVLGQRFFGRIRKDARSGA
jgi:hypothetical protein